MALGLRAILQPLAVGTTSTRYSTITSNYEHYGHYEQLPQHRLRQAQASFHIQKNSLPNPTGTACHCTDSYLRPFSYFRDHL